MRHKNTITTLVLCIAVLAVLAASTGILTHSGPGAYDHQSIRGKTVRIYGRGLYQHMSAELVPQGIAQDYVTLFAGVPLMLASLAWARRGALKGRFLLAGSLAYLLVTYLFYLVMAMYNVLFLVYAALAGMSFFAFALTMLSFDVEALPGVFRETAPARFAGSFLIVNGLLIAMMWLSIVVPPLLNGSIYPREVEHYTTLIVQGMDLGILLPLAVVTGMLLMRKTAPGFLLGPVYLVFLSLLMTALIAKLIAMGINGYNIIPAIFIIPVIALVAIISAALMLRNVNEPAMART